MLTVAMPSSKLSASSWKGRLRPARSNNGQHAHTYDGGTIRRRRGQQWHARRQQAPPAPRPPAGRPAVTSGSPGACLEPRILVRAGRHRQVPQRIHVLPDPWLHPGPDGDRHHDGPLRLQRGSHRGGGVAVLGRPQTGRIRRDWRLRDVCPLTRERRLAQARRLARSSSWPLRCWAWSSSWDAAPWATRTGSTSARSPSSPPKPPSLPSRSGWPRCLTARPSSSTNGATRSFRSCSRAPSRSWASSSPETTSARP